MEAPVSPCQAVHYPSTAVYTAVQRQEIPLQTLITVFVIGRILPSSKMLLVPGICHLTWGKGCDRSNSASGSEGGVIGRINIISIFLIRQRRGLEGVREHKTSKELSKGPSRTQQRKKPSHP